MPALCDPQLMESNKIHSDRPASEKPWLPMVLVLTAIYAINFIDRQIINVLVEPIKNDLGLSDGQIGALTGLAFALVYGLTVVPIARLAERVDRPRMIAAAMVVWSGATALCGVAQNFGQLAAARLVVGLGEAGYAPASYSLMADAVPVRRRTIAFGIFSTGPQIGLMIAFTLGGVIAGLWNWRAAFLIVGLPGLLLAVVALLTLPEPRRSAAHQTHRAGGSFRHDVTQLMRKRSFRLFVLAGGLTTMTGLGVPAFITSFFLRNHAPAIEQLTGGAGIAVLGPVLGLILGTAGIISSLASGAITDRLVARDAKHYGTVAGLPQFVGMALLAATLYCDSLIGALALLGLYLMFANAVGPPLAAGLQALASPTNRATASALSIVALILLGNALGPLLIGTASDVAVGMGYASGDALRIALLVGTIPSLVGAALFLRARHYLAQEIADAAILAAPA